MPSHVHAVDGSIFRPNLKEYRTVEDQEFWRDEVFGKIFASQREEGTMGLQHEVLYLRTDEAKIRFTKISGKDLAWWASLNPIIGDDSVMPQIVHLARAGGGAIGESEREPSAKGDFQGNGPLSEEGRRGKNVQYTSGSFAGKTVPGTEQSKAGKDFVSGGFDVGTPATQHHEGYWLDPTDKDSHIGENDPVIYVRLNGKAERTRLSEAKSKYNVPASANRDTMTLYSEETGDILLDRGTHQK